jgi:medium-chain acyl-[acyl-carrier-protein] hydrolase
MPPEIEIWAAQLPGRENRISEQPFTHLLSLVETLSPAFLPYINQPFAFFGHSMGALLSFEVARFLQQGNHPLPIQLFVSGCRAPQLLRRDEMFHQLPAEAFIAKIRDLTGTPEAVLNNAELMEWVLPVLRADFAMVETYTYQASHPLACGITALAGLEDERASPEEVAAWQEQTRHTFKSYTFPGDHFFLHSVQEWVLQAIVNNTAVILAGSAA